MVIKVQVIIQVPPNRLHGFPLFWTPFTAIQQRWLGSSKPRRQQNIHQWRGVFKVTLPMFVLCFIGNDIVINNFLTIFWYLENVFIDRVFIDSPSHKIAWPFHESMNVLKVLKYPFWSVAFAINWSNPSVGIIFGVTLVHPDHQCQRSRMTCTVASFPPRNLNMQILGHRTTIFWSLRLVCWQCVSKRDKADPLGQTISNKSLGVYHVKSSPCCFSAMLWNDCPVAVESEVLYP